MEATPFRIPIDLFACPSCRGTTLTCSASTANCASCSASYPINDGIVDFVAGTQRTTLDNVDYDTFYMVDASRISHSFHILQTHTGSLFRIPFRNVLEIGAGTGLMTAGLLQNVSIERLVVTDVSHKMLTTCRGRVRSSVPARPTELFFATNDGIRFGLAPNTFDLVLGYFVVHHVTDYEKTLAAAFEATHERGIAVFVEPNRRFFHAMVLVVSRVIQRLLPVMPDEPGSDLSKLLNLNNEWEFTLRHSGNRRVLAAQEDKHFFSRTDFEQACHDGGWRYADSIPLDPSGGPLATAKAFATQLGLSPEGYARFIDTFASELPGPFALLDEVDSSPSYVFLAARRAAERELWHQSLPRSTPARVPLDPPLLGYTPRYDLKISVSTQPPYVDVQGWAATTRPVMRIVILAEGLRASFAVGVRRSDVYSAIQHVRTIPFENALHSGVRFMDEGPTAPLPHAPEALRVTLELDDGNELLLAERLRLAPKGPGDWHARLSRVG